MAYLKDMISLPFKKMMNHYFPLSALLFANAMTCSAQVPVSQEPRHHNVFENKWVRVLDVHIPPGDTSLMHKHSTPSVFIVLSNTKTGSEVLVEPAKTHFTDGNIWFEGFYDKPRIHRVWNSDTVEFHVVDMELLNRNNQTVDPPMDLKSLTLLFDEKPVRGYRANLPANSSLRLPRRKAPFMVIGLSNITGSVTVNNKPFVKKGDFIFLQPDHKIEFDNKGNADENFAIFELK